MIIVSVSETMQQDIGRGEILVSFSDYQQTSPTEAIITYARKRYRGIIHQAKDGLHWTEIVASVPTQKGDPT